MEGSGGVANMNSRERFLNIVQNRPVDRRPFGAILSLYGASLTGCPLERYYNDPAAYALGQDAVRQEIEPDFLTGPFMLAGYGEAFGSTLIYPERYVPNILRPVISGASEISKLIVPDIDTHPRILYIRDSIRRIAANHGKDAVIVAIVLNPLDLPLVIMGLDAWLLTILTDENGTRRMLDITVPFFVRLCEAVLSDGADSIAMPMSFFTEDITTDEMVSDFAMPVLREALQQVSGRMIFHHTGSTFFNYLDILDSLPGASGFTLNIHDDMPEARRLLRKDTFIYSGFDGPTLQYLTPDMIRTRCMKLLSQMKDDSRYVPFATGTDVDLRTSVEHLVALRQAVEEFGSG
jgi:uroporphyrinogen decarboxylase